MTAQPTHTTAAPLVPPPNLGPHSTFQEDVDHWVYRLKSFIGNTKSVEVEGTKEWSSGFFSCFTPIDLCLITCCLPCVTFGKTHHRLSKDKNLAGYSPVNASCLGFFASTYCCLACVPLLLQRTEIRKRSQPHLSGDLAMDVLKGICCGCCNLIQQEKEAEYLLSHESNQYINEQPGALKQDMSYGAPAAITAGPGANYGHQQTYTHDQKVAM